MIVPPVLFILGLIRECIETLLCFSFRAVAPKLCFHFIREACDSTQHVGGRAHIWPLYLRHYREQDLTGHFQDAFRSVSPSTQPCIILYCWNFPRGQNSDWFGWSPVVIQPYISSIEGLPGILPWRIQFHLAQCVHSLNGSVPPERLKNGWLRSRSKELLQSSCTVKLILIKIDYSIWDTWVINF